MLKIYAVLICLLFMVSCGLEAERTNMPGGGSQNDDAVGDEGDGGEEGGGEDEEDPIDQNDEGDASNGARLYGNNCANCHGALVTSKKRNKSADKIQYALRYVQKMSSIQLNEDEIKDIAAALKD